MACPNNHSFFHMYYHAKRRDVNFYVDFAVESGGTVLEIGCGTGRILIPTTRVGINITGLDKSEEMLSICRRKLESEPPDKATFDKLADYWRGDLVGELDYVSDELKAKFAEFFDLYVTGFIQTNLLKAIVSI